VQAENPIVAQPLDGTDVHRLSDGSLPGAELPPPGRGADDRRQRLIAGLTWNVVYQAIEVALSFGAMLLLVRIIAPRDYGRAAAVVGILAMLNTLNAHMFYEQALQLPEGETPDWSLHWTFGFYLQTAMSIVCHLVAGVCWTIPAYRPVAKLLHLAAFGVWFDAPNTLGAAMLRRDLNFERLKIVAGCGMFARLTTTVALGLAGGGAYAIVFGGNVISSLPFAIDLLLIRRWRPNAGWWRRFDWRRYRDASQFGLQRTATRLVGGVRDGLEAAILPGTLGFVSIGLVNRAQALYGTTVGRLGVVFADTVYPFLPREKQNKERYASHATLYLQVMSFIAVPGALFIGRHGSLLSRVLYGSKWAAADPLIWPAAVIGLGLTAFSIASEILLAAGLLRVCLALDVLAAASVLPALVAAWTTRLALPYAWTLAGVQAAVALVALGCASRLLERGWWRITAGPAIVAALAGLGAGWLLPMRTARPAIQLAIQAVVFVVAGTLSLRIFFGAVLDRLVTRVPAGHHLRGVLFLPKVRAEVLSDTPTAP
jgi:O-antigen/teichoic acid export membrane protein